MGDYTAPMTYASRAAEWLPPSLSATQVLMLGGLIISAVLLVFTFKIFAPTRIIVAVQIIFRVSLTGSMTLIAACRGIWTTVRGRQAVRNRSIAVTSLVGVVCPDGSFVHCGAAMSPIKRIPLHQASVAALYDLTTLSPLARALLECYAAVPNWPASAASKRQAHGTTTLLQHVIAVRTTALDLAASRGLSPELAELAALSHDLGKLIAYRQAPDGLWTRISSCHDHLSGILLASFPEWNTLTPDDQTDLTVAVSYHHRPAQRPITASTRATHLLILLREADGLATARESAAHRHTARTPFKDTH